MRRSRSSFGFGHASKGAAKVCARASLVSRLWFVEWVDQFGGRLKVRSASSRSAVALDIVNIPVSSRQRTPFRMCEFAAIVRLIR
jgi:hypothetical protein